MLVILKNSVVLEIKNQIFKMFLSFEQFFGCLEKLLYNSLFCFASENQISKCKSASKKIHNFFF